MALSQRLFRPPDIEDRPHPEENFAFDVLMGLSSSPKEIPSKYFYDDEGSRLFERITGLPEYYPTRCEREILDKYHGEIGRGFGGAPFNLVELGPGDGHKTKVLLQSLQADSIRFRYMPIDISESAQQELIGSLRDEFPRLEVDGLVADYFAGLRWLSRSHDSPTLVLFLGSNIGNFSRAESISFLRSLWNTLKDGDRVLIGFDLKKDIDVMLAAYNDSEGVTRDFNLNLLHRINRELGGNFEPSRFRFFSTYDVFAGSINSYLVSKARQTVKVKAVCQSFQFEPWEPIRTEFSYKYLESDIAQMAEETGFDVIGRFYDTERYFTDSLWRVRKNEGSGRRSGSQSRARDR